MPPPGPLLLLDTIAVSLIVAIVSINLIGDGEPVASVDTLFETIPLLMETVERYALRADAVPVPLMLFIEIFVFSKVRIES